MRYFRNRISGASSETIEEVWSRVNLPAVLSPVSGQVDYVMEREGQSGFVKLHLTFQQTRLLYISNRLRDFLVVPAIIARTVRLSED